ncbi:hypothetical protein [Schaalia sp. ORNL0103]|uniref:hypothetical protein n=1 Tax=Schaalia sp. ORNL0103 TaxID=2789426 RepID=UPI001CA490D3|nr:hypothetical protein [Schaalia sp. ORNL0103]MBW6413144.1 hypothetical protein [Schaalia sp. ORNL0103]
MLVRYTRQLATAALIVAAGLGMGACSAHPGAAVVTSSGVTYSNAEVEEAAQQLFDMKASKSTDIGYAIRKGLANHDLLVAAGAAVGVSVTDAQVDAFVQQMVQRSGGVMPAQMGRVTRVLLENNVLADLINMKLQQDPTLEGSVDAAVAQYQEASSVTINPRFPQPSLGGGQAPTMPLFGDAVSGAKDDPMAALLGGNAH